MAGVNNAPAPNTSIHISARVIPDGVNAEEGNTIFVLGEPGLQQIQFTVRNLAKKRVRFDNYSHKCNNNELADVSLKDDNDIGSGGSVVFLQPAENTVVTMLLAPKKFVGCAGIQARIRFRFHFGDEDFSIVRYVAYDIIPKESRELYNLLGDDTDVLGAEFSGADDDDDLLEIIWLGKRYYTDASQLAMIIELEMYYIPKYIKGYWRWPLHVIIAQLELKLRKWDTYESRFHGLLYYEELQCEIDIKAYTIYRTRMSRASMTRDNQQRFKLKVRGLMEKRPSLIRGDRIFAQPLIEDSKYKYEGEILDIAKDEVYLIFNPKFNDDIEDAVERYEFKIQFRFNRIVLRQMHRAVEMAVTNDLERCLFPEVAHGHISLPNLEFFNKRIESNPRQMNAVKHIVGGTSIPAPYIIYGPPGTGKTFTLVETIKQVYRRPTSSILVCAPSNAAADLVTKGLLEDVSREDILRMHAASRPFASYDSQIRSVSNCSKASLQTVYPPREEIELKRIIVTTLVTSGRLVTADMSHHFTHIFIDEAGFATEPETLIPLPLLKPRGQLVLAGDPKQLGPVIRSHIALAGGLGTSLLKTLMDDRDIYKPNANNEYNPRYVTKLVHSFRSHPDIIKIPNEHFYKGELIVKAAKEQREMFCTWTHLPSGARANMCPMIFHSVVGREEQERHSPSWLNKIEVLQVHDYVKKLLFNTENPKVTSQQIGIISPYHGQVTKIRKALKETFGGNKSDVKIEDLKVGSVEKFQGDERDVIIISTVRSENAHCADVSEKSNLGFLANEKRFNVAVTRAKALLIIVGNPITLSQEKNWRRLIEHIIDSGGYVGRPERAIFLDKLSSIPVREVAEPNASGSTKLPSLYQQEIDNEWIPGEK